MKNYPEGKEFNWSIQCINTLKWQDNKIYSFVCFDFLHHTQQFFSCVVTGLPGLNHY